VKIELHRDYSLKYKKPWRKEKIWTVKKHVKTFDKTRALFTSSDYMEFEYWYNELDFDVEREGELAINKMFYVVHMLCEKMKKTGLPFAIRIDSLDLEYEDHEVENGLFSVRFVQLREWSFHINEHHIEGGQKHIVIFVNTNESDYIPEH